MISININDSSLINTLGVLSTELIVNDDRNGICNYSVRGFDNANAYSIMAGGQKYCDENAGIAFAVLTKKLIEVIFRMEHGCSHQERLFRAMSCYSEHDAVCATALKIKWYYDELCSSVFSKYIFGIPSVDEMMELCHAYAISNHVKIHDYQFILKDPIFSWTILGLASFENPVEFMNWVKQFNKLELFCLYDILTDKLPMN